MKIAEGELRQILIHDLKLPAKVVRELVADARQSGKHLLQTTLDSKHVTETQIATAHAKRLRIPFIDLKKTELAPRTVATLPRQIAARYHVICFDETPSSIKLAMGDPRDERARKAVRDYVGKTVRRYLATDSGLTEAMRAYPNTNEPPLPFSTRDLLATILEQAIRNNSHDIHFEPQSNELVIRRRVGKGLQTMSTLPLAKARALLSWCKLQTGNDVGDTERPAHGRFSMRIDGALHDVMMSSVPVVDGEKMVLRLVPPSDSIPSLRELGYTAKQDDSFEHLITDGRGLIVIAGGNAADASTTLASLTKQTASKTHTTVTSIEEPLQYHIANVAQVEVTPALPLSDIVDTVVAQNPTCIVTRNLGNGSSAEQLVDFALGQHMVISGLYATSLTSALHRLMGYPIAPALMAASLRLIAVQHHIEALCSTCRTSFAPAGPLKKALWKQFDFSNDTRLYRKGPGCENCHAGVNKTVLATEWLLVTPEFQQLLATRADAAALKQYAAEHSDYRQQLGRLASKGLISIDEATARVA